MGLTLFSRKHKIVNLVIKDHVLRYVELKQTNPLIVQKCGEYYLPPGLIKDGRVIDRETLSTILEQCVADWKIRKKQVRMIVPDPFIVVRKLEIPKDVEGDEITGYLYMELGSSIHLPFEEPVFDTVILGEAKDKKEILLFAAPEDIVKEYSSLLEDCGLIPVAADISPLSLYRFYHALDKSRTEEHLLMIQLDVGSMGICIFEGEKPIFMRHIQLPGTLSSWETSLTGTGNTSLVYEENHGDIEAAFSDIFNELDRIMNFYRYTLRQGQQSITKILLAGDNPFKNKVFEELVVRFNLFVDRIDSHEVHTVNQTPLPDSFYVTLGLALKEV
ncbi:type IV pilus biogenesis protein PilM [Peribacillus deserti]|uniref:Pilus assembly protein PilM n=1 Tax=Peribacillus deserti TaxID=673318 RepID=A0A2N5M718_9BACI|nr:pilus assembly protein PilM [Peribacillus deserti]PLT30150.1 pilus assembly protein PilM [Peribacillus deserti]